ncbi:MAG: hypothetical protein RDU20_21315 [Desulfomonilaceae bacterium]|nr:hypothetical protein [Desulfomonilaceae bacterium]
MVPPKERAADRKTAMRIPMNLCRPDTSKSCAACCGLYNVGDGTRLTLRDKLTYRTDRFRDVIRSPDALAGFESEVRARERTVPYDEVIHVCEFAGFVDAERRSVGCMLHPCAPGNEGRDWRGMCHYGGMACKSFHCPAWEELSDLHKRIVTDIVDDWHLYGLVITDVDFILSLFELVEEHLGLTLDDTFLRCDSARSDFLRILKWKDSGILPGDSSATLRLSRYYINASTSGKLARGGGPMDRILACLEFTYGHSERIPGAERLVSGGIGRFVSTYRQWIEGVEERGKDRRR